MDLKKVGALPPYWPNLKQCLDVQFLCLAEEAGEAIQAYRQASGQARRADLTWTDVGKELADVVIVAAHAANLLGLDLDAIVEEKIQTVWQRIEEKRAINGRR